MNLLESAGFSRSNPYYIVKQGKVSALYQVFSTANFRKVPAWYLLTIEFQLTVYDDQLMQILEAIFISEIWVGRPLQIVLL